MTGWEARAASDTPSAGRQLAYFISAHGFGHAARACAVIAALRARCPACHFHLFTQVPPWFFAESLGEGYTYHAVTTDVGVVQHDAMREDLPATVRQLDDFYPFDDFLLRAWAAWLERLGCELVVCDIAPLGLAAARAAGLPVVLVENFTWDWIYAGYVAQEAGLARHVEYLRSAFAQAEVHLQAEPLCQPSPRAGAALPPISRSPRQAAAAVRHALDVPAPGRLVLVTMGGVPGGLPQLDSAAARLPSDIYLVVPGASHNPESRGRLRLLPHHSPIYHPDLVHAADAVLGKAGYSTVAEAYWAGAPFGYVPRPHFRESGPLAAFIQAHMRGQEISPADLAGGQWLDAVPELLAMPRIERAGVNGAVLAADRVLDCLGALD